MASSCAQTYLESLCNGGCNDESSREALRSWLEGDSDTRGTHDSLCEPAAPRFGVTTGSRVQDTEFTSPLLSGGRIDDICSEETDLTNPLYKDPQKDRFTAHSAILDGTPQSQPGKVSLKSNQPCPCKKKLHQHASTRNKKIGFSEILPKSKRKGAHHVHNKYTNHSVGSDHFAPTLELPGSSTRTLESSLIRSELAQLDEFLSHETPSVSSSQYAGFLLPLLKKLHALNDSQLTCTCQGILNALPVLPRLHRDTQVEPQEDECPSPLFPTSDITTEQMDVIAQEYNREIMANEVIIYKFSAFLDYMISKDPNQIATRSHCKQMVRVLSQMPLIASDKELEQTLTDIIFLFQEPQCQNALIARLSDALYDALISIKVMHGVSDPGDVHVHRIETGVCERGLRSSPSPVRQQQVFKALPHSISVPPVPHCISLSKERGKELHDQYLREQNAIEQRAFGTGSIDGWVDSQGESEFILPPSNPETQLQREINVLQRMQKYSGSL
ncbi:hypothetical protein Pelo_1537 [Pelomyxa schiedti]|nr:hypothetical protein Pelo_1537 [Pelomyxa schiedti]